ncbi:MAG: phosphonate ABC transporter ATP-binding protein, partial [Azorhizobium sp. 39-67-5]
QRIIGLKAGRIVFDGPPDALDTAALTAIYGEEDWSRTIREAEDDAADEAAAQDAARLVRAQATPAAVARAL